MDLIARYHLSLAAFALAVGCGVAIGDRLVPSARPRVVAFAGFAGALLGGAGSPRSWPWWLLAAVPLLFLDDESKPHPLGRAALPLTVLSLIGVWSAVPDTEPALAVGALLAPVAVVRALKGPAVGAVGTASLVVAISGAVWVGSAGWGAALATICVVGLVAWAPLVDGFGCLPDRRYRAPLVAIHGVVVLTVPRLIMRRPVPVAWTVAAAVTVGFLVLLSTVSPSRGEVSD